MGLMDLRVRVTSAAMLTDNRKELRATLRKAGGEVLAAAKAKIRKGGSGRTYRGSGGGTAGGARQYLRGKFAASAPGQPPASVTGTLKRSGRVRPFKSGDGVAVRFNAFYAAMLEGGARGGGPGKRFRARRGKPGLARVLRPRPFLSTAMAERRASIDRRVKAAVEQGTQFVRIKPTP